MERLRDTKPIPGSPEAILVEAIKAIAPVEPTIFQQRHVLERVLDRQRARRSGAAMFLRPIVVIGVLLVAGVTAAATFGHSWIAKGLRSFATAEPVAMEASNPTAATRPHRRALPSDELVAAGPTAPIETAPVLAPVAIRATPRLAARSHASRTEDPSLVVDAIRALRTDGDSRRAATLLAAYLRTYPRGALSEEALALSIEAAAAGRNPNAAVFAAQYLSEYPHGRFRRAAEQALEQRQP